MKKKYTVVYLKGAENHLADLYVKAAAKEAVTDAANGIDAILSQDPYLCSDTCT